MEEKDALKVKKHILEFGNQELIDKIYGKNKFYPDILKIIKEVKVYSHFKFLGELLINVPSTKKLIESDFYGGFNEGEHYLIIDSYEDVEKFEKIIIGIKTNFEEKKDSNRDISSFLKIEYQSDETVINTIKDSIKKKETLTNKKEIYLLMSKTLQYIKSKKLLNELFDVGVNYYRELEKEFKEEK